jgi:glyoxylase-like metal-dependent hydrolase (beta-lactamase superfamily II)
VRLTKYGHSCVRLDDGDRALVCDPGVFSETEAALAGADAVLITHEHPDHIDEGALRSAALANPELRIWAPAGVAAALADLGEQVTVAGGGQAFEAAGFAVQTFGQQHAVIHSSIPVVANVGYLIDGAVFHPGDAFTVPSAPVSTLLAPITAPWARVGEVIDYIIAVRAPQVFQLHDAIANDLMLGLVERLIPQVTGPYGIEYTHLAPTAAVTL